MSTGVARSQQEASFVAEVAGELVARRPEVADAVTTTDAGLGVAHPAGGTILVGQARFACVLGWAVAGPESMGLWPAAGDDVDGIVTEVLRRYDA